MTSLYSLRYFKLILFISLVFCLILPLAPSASASFPGENGKVLYKKYLPVKNPSGAYETYDPQIYIANADGSEEALFSSTDLPSPMFSPDGHNIILPLAPTKIFHIPFCT